MPTIQNFFTLKKVLVTAGATYENIDPVRFIGNRSSGKMGIALANVLARLGATVYLIKAHTEYGIQIHPRVHLVLAESSSTMNERCQEFFPNMDMAIMAAAVADFTPVSYTPQKIKKHSDTFTLLLQKTPDILASLGRQKTNNQYLVGFALETENAIDNALKKMHHKNCDMMILNVLQEDNLIFGSDSNRISIFTKSMPPLDLGYQKKEILAKKIIATIYKICTS